MEACHQEVKGEFAVPLITLLYVQNFRNMIQRDRKSFLCHFWASSCEDDDEEEEETRRLSLRQTREGQDNSLSE